MNSRAKIAFAVVSLLWGIPYLLIKVAVDDGVTPAFVAWVRVVLGAIILIGITQRKGLLQSVRGRVKWLVAFALTEIVIPFPLIATGERHIDSSVAAILIASAPLFVALLALRFDATERVSGSRLAGLFIGLAGVITFVGIDFAGRRDELLGALAVLVSAFFYAVGPMILKRHLSDLDPRTSMGVSLVIAAILLAPFAAMEPIRTLPPTKAIVALLCLGFLCTAVAFVAYGILITEAGAGRALIITYINPVIAVGVGMLFRSERPGRGALLGLALILLGSWISTGGRLPRRSSSAASCPDPSGDLE